MATQWTDELFDKLKNEYLTRMQELPEESRPVESMSVVAELAGDNGVAVNSFRSKLIQAGVYIKKGPATPAAASKEAKTGGTRTSKDAAHAELKAAFTDAGIDADEIDADIISKLTGKAAAHLTELIRKITK